MNTSFEIENLKCGGCANTIQQALNSFQGLSKTRVDVENGSVSFDFNKASLVDAVKEKLQSLGYPEKGTLTGMKKFGANARSYVSCAIGKINADSK